MYSDICHIGGYHEILKCSLLTTRHSSSFQTKVLCITEKLRRKLCFVNFQIWKHLFNFSILLSGNCDVIV